MKHAITVDFGSTFTKIVVIDLEEREISLSDRVASSVGTDAAIDLNRCFQLAETVIVQCSWRSADVCDLSD